MKPEGGSPSPLVGEGWGGGSPGLSFVADAPLPDPLPIGGGGVRALLVTSQG
jgi:hypothetical protein